MQSGLELALLTGSVQNRLQLPYLYKSSSVFRGSSNLKTDDAGLKCTDFVVGRNVSYQVNGIKAKIKTSTGKQVDCTIVRVVDVPTELK
jgi:hypothetical protein